MAEDGTVAGGATRRRSAEVAIVASWLVPGLGQLYQGATLRGLVLIALFLAFAIPVWTGAVPPAAFIGPALAVWAWSQVDVWKRAGVRPSDYYKASRQTSDQGRPEP